MVVLVDGKVNELVGHDKGVHPLGKGFELRLFRLLGFDVSHKLDFFFSILLGVEHDHVV